MSNENNIKILKDYKEQGFLFHGSRNKLEIIKPSQADSEDKDKFDVDYAVFASQFIEAAIFFACSPDNYLLHLCSYNNHLDFVWSLDGDKKVITAEIPLMLKDCMYSKYNIGYVHVLSLSTFLEHDSSWQYKSKKAVIPLDAIKVSFSDIERFNCNIKWT